MRTLGVNWWRERKNVKEIEWRNSGGKTANFLTSWVNSVLWNSGKTSEFKNSEFVKVLGTTLRKGSHSEPFFLAFSLRIQEANARLSRQLEYPRRSFENGWLGRLRRELAETTDESGIVITISPGLMSFLATKPRPWASCLERGNDLEVTKKRKKKEKGSQCHERNKISTL